MAPSSRRSATPGLALISIATPSLAAAVARAACARCAPSHGRSCSRNARRTRAPACRRSASAHNKSPRKRVAALHDAVAHARGARPQTIHGDGVAFLSAMGTITTKTLEVGRRPRARARPSCVDPPPAHHRPTRGPSCTARPQTGEVLVVDTSSLIAWESTATLGVRTAGGMCTCCCGGEGLFNTTLTGALHVVARRAARSGGWVVAGTPGGDTRDRELAPLPRAVASLREMLIRPRRPPCAVQAPGRSTFSPCRRRSSKLPSAWPCRRSRWTGEARRRNSNMFRLKRAAVGCAQARAGRCSCALTGPEQSRRRCVRRRAA